MFFFLGDESIDGDGCSTRPPAAALTQVLVLMLSDFYFYCLQTNRGAKENLIFLDISFL